MKGIFFILFVLSIQVLWAEGEDTLKLKGDEPFSTTIKKVTSTMLEYSKDGGTVVNGVQAHKIDWVIFSDAPGYYSQALEQLDRKRFGRAYKSFFKAYRSKLKSKNDWVKKHSLYYMAVCLYYLEANKSKMVEKNVNVSLKYMSKFILDNKDSWLIPRALFYQGRLNSMLKKYPDAEKIFDQLMKQTKVKEYQSMSKIGLAMSKKAQGKADEALNIAMSLINDKQVTDQLIDMVLEILLVDKKDFKKALGIASKLRDHRESYVKQKAYELSGCAAFYLGKYEGALDSLLRSELLYSGRSQPLSSRAKLHIALSLKVLMEKNSKDFPSWEYKGIMDKYVAQLSSIQKKKVKKYKVK